MYRPILTKSAIKTCNLIGFFYQVMNNNWEYRRFNFHICSSPCPSILYWLVKDIMVSLTKESQCITSSPFQSTMTSSYSLSWFRIHLDEGVWAFTTPTIAHQRLNSTLGHCTSYQNADHILNTTERKFPNIKKNIKKSRKIYQKCLAVWWWTRCARVSQKTQIVFLNCVSSCSWLVWDT